MLDDNSPDLAGEELLEELSDEDSMICSYLAL
jgi:hypothetical protein